MSRYWFARYRNYSVYGLRVMKPIVPAGWGVLAASLGAMAGGGLLILMLGGDQIGRGWLGLSYGVWLLACIGVTGAVMNRTVDPEKWAETYTLEAKNKNLEAYR